MLISRFFLIVDCLIWLLGPNRLLAFCRSLRTFLYYSEFLSLLLRFVHVLTTFGILMMVILIDFKIKRVVWLIKCVIPMCPYIHVQWNQPIITPVNKFFFFCTPKTLPERWSLAIYCNFIVSPHHMLTWIFTCTNTTQIQWVSHYHGCLQAL